MTTPGVNSRRLHPVSLSSPLPDMIPTSRRVEYALGYLGLGLHAQAADELAAVGREDCFAPEVMGARVELHLAMKQWKRVVGDARRLLELDQNNVAAWIALGCALRRTESVGAARDLLLRSERLHGAKHAVIHYNLACYTCLLGDLQAAKAHLAKACTMDSEFKTAARDDPDLRAIAAFVREVNAT